MNPTMQYPVFDADNHYYEPKDAFTRYIPRRMAARCIQWADIDGRPRLVVGGRICSVLSNPLFDPVPKPGCLWEYFLGNNPEGRETREMFGELEPIRPEYRSRDARLACLDEQGVEKTLLFPTLGVLIEQYLEPDPEACVAAFHAFNEWLHDDWGFNHKDRIYSAAYLTLADADAALAEVEWALERGVKLIDVRASPPPPGSGARSPADTMFDPIWARLEEAGVLVCTHLANSTRWFHERWEEPPKEPTGFRVLPLKWMLSANRDVADFFAVVITHGLFSRFPNLRMMSVENGAGWVAPLKQLMKKAYGQNPQYFAEDPVQVFDRHVWVTPFWEDSIEMVLQSIPVDRITYGSDWPHVEGTEHPLDYLCMVAELDEATQHRIMHDNAAAALGLTR
jgi:predicted TIM-barrel fold metal-dependent hydrolase